MKQIEAGDESHTVVMTFKDNDNEFMIPTVVSYKVYNVTEETVVAGPTSLTPATQIEVDLTGAMVALIDSTNTKELHRICVTATDAFLNEYPRCIEYEVIPATECDCG